MTGSPPLGAPAHWYPDPHDVTGWRYWDGEQWTDHTAPGQAVTGTSQPLILQAPRTVAGLGTASLWLAAALALAQVGVAASAFNGERNAMRDAETGSITFGLYDAFGLLILPVGVAAYVVTSLWLWRCRTNVEILRPAVPQARGRIWIWLGWFVPFVALWFPVQVVRDIGTQPAENTELPHRPPALGWWWASWLVSNFMDSGGFSVTLSGNTAMLALMAELEVVSAVALVTGLVFWARIVQFIQRDQAELLRRAGFPA